MTFSVRGAWGEGVLTIVFQMGRPKQDERH